MIPLKESKTCEVAALSLRVQIVELVEANWFVSNLQAGFFASGIN